MGRHKNPFPPHPKQHGKRMEVWWNGTWWYLGMIADQAGWQAEYSRLLAVWANDLSNPGRPPTRRTLARTPSADRLRHPSAGLSFQPVPIACTVRFELRTQGENAYRVTFTVEGETEAEVRDMVTRELRRRHWDVEARGEGLVLVYGFTPAEGPTEPIAGLTVTMCASQPGVPPPFPGLGYDEGVRCEVLIQMEPGLGRGTCALPSGPGPEPPSRTQA
ncbi:MAG: hypothetical protein JWO38_924 [Gemmataceae bacterium]|nr:hypothetical protein [Gemmataceae bacterium]